MTSPRTATLFTMLFVITQSLIARVDDPRVALAAGPREVALIDRADWPLPLDSRAGFDTASRAEILVFLEVFFDLENRDQDYSSLLGVTSVHADSIARWRDEVLARMTANLGAARSTCQNAAELGCPAKTAASSDSSHGRRLPRDGSPSGPPSPDSAPSSPSAPPSTDIAPATPPPSSSSNLREVLKAAVSDFKAHLPPDYVVWHRQARHFCERYVMEQLRLAALFPSPTSEILTFSAQEVTGADWEDLHFLFTFDDGPSTRGGNTDRMLEVLSGLKVNGLFFVLGEAFRSRLEAESKEALQALYSGQCVGSHGAVHRPHPRLETWQESIRSTQTLITETIDQNSPRVFFRPPYGQRTEEMVHFVAAQGSKLLLWNIDTQDWNEKVSAARAADRAVTLMLLWRRGIILFHDVHAKAQAAVPSIMAQTAKTGVMWLDCRTLKNP